ncbi:MAG: acetyl-CoA acetyltransferase [Burkholderiales bacterium]|nr:acetyl-CoA acetyltransferase [Burkholderiales bacterium]
MLSAVRNAGADALPEPAALLAGVHRIGVPKGRWRYRNPGGELARAIGADHAVSLLASVGVLQQTLIGDACRAIVEGDADTTLVVGGDTGYRILRAQIQGARAHERQQDDAPLISLAPKDELLHPAELRAGIKMPVGLYAIMESAYRARNRWSVDEHRDRLAAMYGRFSEIAAENPAAWNRRRIDPDTIRNASERNPMQAFPYTKLHCSTWNVDQAGALLFCSAKRADDLGIPLEKRIYPVASTESNDMAAVTSRGDLAACPGARIAARAALDAGDLSLSDVELVDLYTCFPVAVEAYAAEIGLPLSRDLTVTGSMAFAGGPYNNYVIQATCRIAELLRQGRGRHGLVSSVSGVLTKQAFGVWSREPARNGFVLRDVSEDVNRATKTVPIVELATGDAAIAGYTVLYERGEPRRGVAVVDAVGGRAIVQSKDPTIMARMESVELCGTVVRLADGSFIM